MSFPGSEDRPDDGARSFVGTSRLETVYSAIKLDLKFWNCSSEELLRIDRRSRAYGVGSTPLRETLQRLTADRLFIARGGWGFQDAPLTIAEFEDLDIARTAIEQAALLLSLKHSNDESGSRPVPFGYMPQKLDLLMLETPIEAIDSWKLANADFHSTLFAGGPSRCLLRTQERLGSKDELYRRVAVAKAGPPWQKDVAQENKKLLAAGLKRDIEKACDLIATHFFHLPEAVCKLLHRNPSASAYDA